MAIADRSTGPIDGDVARLFWTGGWDSTFRLLQLLILLKKKVQPYYLIDEDRLSTGIEIRTMKAIKEHISEKYPRARSLMLPTVFKAVYDIKPNKELTENYNEILTHDYIGSQYEWLARFCSETCIYGIELSIHKNGQNSGPIKLLKPFIIQSGSVGQMNYIFNKDYIDTGEYKLFRFYNFPLFNLDKIEMLNIARKEGFDDFLDLTWFCHKPRKDNRPCGVCTPCIQVIENGLGTRIPLSNRIRYYYRNRSRIIQQLVKRLYVFERD